MITTFSYKLNCYDIIQEMFNNEEYFKKIAKENYVLFRALTSVKIDNIRANRKDIENRLKELIDNLVLKYGASEAILKIQNFMEILDKLVPDNTLKSVFQEVLEEIERIYMITIDIKLMNLLNLSFYNRLATTDKLINIINRQENEAYLLEPIAKISEDLPEQLSFYEMEEKEERRTNYSLMVSHQLKIRKEVCNYIEQTMGWDGYKNWVLDLIDFLAENNLSDKINPCFIKLLIKESDCLLKMNEKVKTLKKVKSINHQVNLED